MEVLMKIRMIFIIIKKKKSRTKQKKKNEVGGHTPPHPMMVFVSTKNKCCGEERSETCNFAS